ncbi:MAG: VanW family protein [Dehalococcoidia bacterium]
MRTLRWISDRRTGERFALAKSEDGTFSFEWARYERPFIDYPGQEQLGGAKRRNQVLLAEALHGTVIRPGECFSVWVLAGRPTMAKGYLEAAALRSGKLTTDIGGAVCLLSTVLYNVALLAGMEIRKRSCHSVDSYGEKRYFELGRDAAIEFGYTDLRFSNPHSVALRLNVLVESDRIQCSINGPELAPGPVGLDVSPPELLAERIDGWLRFRVRTVRVMGGGRDEVIEDVGESIYRIPRELEGEFLQACALTE